MANNLTIFQRLNNAFRGNGQNNVSPNIVTTPSSQRYTQDRVLYSTSDKADYERKLAALRQQKYMSYVWQKAGADNAMESLAGYTAVKLMYRDADLMDGCPEIGSGLDIISEEACPIVSKGKMINIKSNSPRIKAMLEDLFVNRLHIYTDLPMIARHMVKYGNTFMLLNLDQENGVMGWRMLPVYEMDRLENGYISSYTIGTTIGDKDIKPDEVRFVWNGHNENNPYRNWQIAHFRLLNDSFFLPYGVSLLHKARRAWRMWSMMEDALLIWKLDKAIERRVYKIYVGAIDDADVPAYVQEIANNFKRTPIVDPATGQIDLRKNFLDVSSDYFIPVRREDAPNPIETLQSANSQGQMEGLDYMQNKMFCALRVPKSFLNFQEAQGKGQNLSFIDVRFSRMINRVQQFLLMELNKIALIHLYLMGLHDELNNFTLTLNNPSSQIEAQELDDINKRLAAMQIAVADPGNGIPMMSMHKALKDIMKMTDSEIKDMMCEIYLEKAMAAEIQGAANIIKKSGQFETVKRIFGDYEALNSDNPPTPQNNGEEDGLGGGAGSGGAMGGGIGGDMGDADMDLGEPGTEDGTDVGGDMGETNMSGAPDADNGSPLQEIKKRKFPVLKESKNKVKKEKTKSFMERYFEKLNEGIKKEELDNTETITDFLGKEATMDKTINEVFDKINSLIDEKYLAEDVSSDSSVLAENKTDDTPDINIVEE